jgi:hypothetical protein
MRMLAYGAHVDSRNKYLRMTAWVSTIPIECTYKFCRVVVRKFGKDYLRRQNKADTVMIMAQNAREYFLRCLETSIACTGHGRTSYLIGKICTKDIPDTAVWYSKLWQIITCGFCILSLVWLDHTMTLMCCSALRCSWNSWKVMLHHTTMRWMATRIPRGTI